MKAQTHDKLHTMMDEDVIICRILEGQTGLYRLLVNQYAEPTLSVIGRIVPIQEDAEDVLQDTFVAAYQSLASFDKEKASFKTWLMNIACHTALKRVQRAADVDFVSIEQEVYVPVSDEEVDEMLDDDTPNRVELLGEAVRQLAPDDQCLLNLYYYDDMRLRDIATVMARAESYLRSRLQWIRKRLCHTIKTLENNESK
ncbi:MAG: sigma-70 family RNA polymerase sigma factor [Bacteroidaceae bacterium]|nr:sigma-70 family RNA polymerase sigma factor [Bacteroidaceae bacterium]